jgi:hypothetical protein
MRIRATLLATGTHWGQNDQERVSWGIESRFKDVKVQVEKLSVTFWVDLHAREKIK